MGTGESDCILVKLGNWGLQADACAWAAGRLPRHQEDAGMVGHNVYVDGHGRFFPAARSERVKHTAVVLCHRLALLNGLKASESITAEQSRQMLFDLDTGYSDFHRWLRSKEGNKK